MKRRIKYLLFMICLCFGLAGCSGVTEQIADMAQNAEQGNRTGMETVVEEGQSETGGTDATGMQAAEETGGTDATGVQAAEETGETDATGMQAAEESAEDSPVQETALQNQGEGEAAADGISEGATLEVHYLDIGQGDSILIQQGESAMLIDAGNNEKGTTVCSYLDYKNVEKLDYAMCTHPDADHIGGMDVVLNALDCDAVFMPSLEHDTVTYEELIRTIGQRQQQVIVPKQGERYNLGEAQFEILTDTEKRYGDNNNDYSLAMRLTFGETSFLFTGDAEVEAEQDMLNSGMPLVADVFKLAHHGAATANTEAFLTAVHPTYAVISCGEGNSYGHPRAEVMNRLRSMGIQVFRTDEQGTIVAVSDGENITFNCSPSTTWKAGEPTGSSTDGNSADAEGDTMFSASGSIVTSDAEYTNGKNSATKGTGATTNGNVAATKETETTTNGQSDAQSGQGEYILNTNSKKFHEPDCGSVKQMSEKNKAYSNASRDELMRQGYEPCKNCEP